MSSKRVLALSSSRAGITNYLETAIPFVKKFLGDKAINIAFVPFASVDNDYEEYGFKVREALGSLPVTIENVLPENAKSIIEKNDGIMVGGGNTFKLLHDIYQLNLLDILRRKIMAGCPYIGWSAGSNITGPTIGTTNDMPIIEPNSFIALNLFPFQINPHYSNQQTIGSNGETRDQRLEEFIKLNPLIKIVCLPEGTALQLAGNKLTFLGKDPGVLFYAEKATSLIRKEISAKTNLSFLI